MKWLAADRSILFPLAVVLVLRGWLGFWGALVIATNGAPIVPNPPTMYHGTMRVPDEGLWLLLAPWQRWDAIWYLRIAEFGYASNNASGAFLPLFPLFIRGVALLTQNYLTAALVVSTLAAFAAFVLLYRLSAEWFDEDTARRAVIYWAVFPTAFYLFAPYAEPLLAASGLAALYFARRKKWALASLGAAAATLARPIGFLIALPLAIEAWRASDSWRERARGLLPLAAMVVAMGAFMLYLHLQFQNAFMWITAEDIWQRVFLFPGTTVVWAVQDILSGQGAVANDVVDLVLTLVVVSASLAGMKYLPLSFSIYALAMILVPLVSFAQAVAYAPAPMAAAGRRALVAFPAFIALAALWRGRWKEPLWIAFSASAQTVLFSIFVKWLWVD